MKSQKDIPFLVIQTNGTGGVHLERHNMNCPAGTLLSGLKLEKNSAKDIPYAYT